MTDCDKQRERIVEKVLSLTEDECREVFEIAKAMGVLSVKEEPDD